ncbi:MAG: glycosyltransferase [Lachnospiraceae bacterium]|nr:glycosyltransferase [Lachnospiraceae bacterium]MDE6942214.1 glycosyltransferase [Lachnospiraceae bacterium]
MKLTVATVCFNAEKTIEATIKSVLDQTYQNIEYLIIDGRSTDRTLELIGKYQTDSRVRVISERDSGLYNAMNKAASACSGEYILYMNSGDLFADRRVLADVVPCLDADIIYGNVIRIRQDGKHLEKYEGKHVVMRLLLMGRMICHQGMFTRADLMRAYRFNEQYTITADYDFVVRAHKNKCSMRHVDRTVAIVDSVEGISSRTENNDIMRREDDRSLRENFPVWYYLIKLPKEFVRGLKRHAEQKGRA